MSDHTTQGRPESLPERLRLTPGQVVDMVLPRQALTGLAWQGGTSDPQVVAAEVVRLPTDPAVLSAGSAGEQSLRLEGVGPGLATVRVELRRAWEQDREPSQAFDLSVVVADDPGGDDVPALARRTYSLLRLGMVGVLLTLATSVILEASRSRCVQTSISAYYYTPTRAVLVGALVALGVSMVVLWGKTWVEDGFLNLAGMLAPVVAFVPTSDANLCSVPGPVRDAAGNKASQLVDTASRAIDNNVEALGIVVGLVLAGVIVAVATGSPWAALLRTRAGAWYRDPTFCLTFGLALGLWVAGLITFIADRSAFYGRAHATSATALFACVVVVVAATAWDKREQWIDRGRGGRDRNRVWMVEYGALAALMVLSGATIMVVGRLTPETWFGVHQTLVLEAALLALFAVFWVLQTIDRLDEGAPRPGGAG